MQTQIIDVNCKENIKLAADVIRSGGLVAFPTETVYGLGADATNKAAVAKIFVAKNRPDFDPLIVHIANTEMLPSVVNTIPETTPPLIDAFWPGPLTLVLQKAKEIPDIVTTGLHTVAVRMPKNASALALIKEAGTPIAAPSANSFGYPSPTRVEHVIEDLSGKIDLILSGGVAQIGIESTVLDLTCSPPVILRPGGVSRESLARTLGKVFISSEDEDGPLKSPGQMKQHYAPRAKVLLFGGKRREKVIQTMRERMAELKEGNRIGIMIPEEELVHFTDTEGIVLGLGSFATMEQVARELFATMRALDKRRVDYILALAPPKEGIGLAVFDRLFKASGSQLIEVD